MSYTPNHVLVTGGAGFIGSAFVRMLLAAPSGPRVTVLDKLTYAGNPANLDPCRDDPRFAFVRGDIAEPADVRAALADADAVVNFAAESHVDRSLMDALDFITTDVRGTAVLLEASREAGVRRFVQVSTDEVYGDIPAGQRVAEDAALRPRSPYAASKAGGDLQCFAFFTSYGFPVLVTRGGNTYGPRQYPEKVIPLFTVNAIEGEPLPLYGDGKQVREWLHVDDHCAAILLALTEGEPGMAYNIGSDDERENWQVAEAIVDALGASRDLIRYVPDRPGHDRRYSMTTARIRALGWSPRRRFDEGLAETVRWYRENGDWWRPLRDEGYREYYRKQYAERLAASVAYAPPGGSPTPGTSG